MTTPHRTPMARLSLRSALVAFALSALPTGGCTKIKKDEPVEHAAQACCTEADEQLQHFKGCAVTRGNCRREERWWMRGYVVCTAVDEANCAGGRCCEYRPQHDAAAQPAAQDAAGVGEEAETKAPAEAVSPDEGKADEAAMSEEDAGTAEQVAPAPDPAPAEADGEDPEAPLP